MIPPPLHAFESCWVIPNEVIVSSDHTPIDDYFFFLKSEIEETVLKRKSVSLPTVSFLSCDVRNNVNLVVLYNFLVSGKV